MRDHLDFIVIGAQKSGTTSLFRYLSEHPSIYMPGKKELAFFSRDKLFSEGVSFYHTHLAEASAEQVVGEASPQYMCYDKCPARIAETFPSAKLIAVLRNPIDRAYSHYRMAKRREYETRPFDECVRELIARGPAADDAVNEQTDFIMFGEYGRILSAYLEHFDREQIKIVWSEELDIQTPRMMRDLFTFLEVDASFESPAFSKRFHVSGERRFPEWADAIIMTWGRRLQRLLKRGKFHDFRFWYETEFNVASKSGEGPDEEIREELRVAFADDVLRLEQLFDVTVPWQEWATPHNVAASIAEPARQTVSISSPKVES